MQIQNAIREHYLMKREADHGSQLFGIGFLGLAEFHPFKTLLPSCEDGEGSGASPALLLSAHLGPCTGTCVPCSRGPELLCLGPGLTCLSLPRATAACPACVEVTQAPCRLPSLRVKMHAAACGNVRSCVQKCMQPAYAFLLFARWRAPRQILQSGSITRTDSPP